MPVIEKAIVVLKKHEGLSLKMYRCPAGYLTIGYGHNLETTPITEMAAEHILMNDVLERIGDLAKIFLDFNAFPEHRQVALINMHFQTGSGGFRMFGEMIKAIKANDLDRTIAEMMDSEWYRRYTTRAKEVIAIYKGEQTT